MNNGKIYVVGIGPGNMQDISIRAYNILKNIDVIAGYTTYVDLVKDEFLDKEFLVSGMKKEIERCREVLEVGIMLEVAMGSGIEIEVVPGITSTIAGAALVGAPLMHDQAIISLSDLLTDWEVIKKRIDCASQGDFAISLYNPKSKGRTEQIVEAREIMLKHKLPTTPVALLRHIGRKEENYTLTTLEDFLNFDIDMFTIVLVGNSNTYIRDGKMITPRGYEKKSNWEK